jgi:aminoglycoside 6'-N-acetyltransferase I
LAFRRARHWGRAPLHRTFAAVVEIVPLETLNAEQREQAADILHRALAHQPSAYSIEEAREEVAKFDGDEQPAFAALENGKVIGWIGTNPVYDHAWELHPLVVDPAHHGAGTGTALIAHLESYARQHEVMTLYLGTDDDFGGTNLSGVDLFPNVLEKLNAIKPVKGHPFTFYRQRGFEIVGVIPNGNGFGQPDIMMAKRIA